MCPVNITSSLKDKPLPSKDHSVPQWRPHITCKSHISPEKTTPPQLRPNISLVKITHLSFYKMVSYHRQKFFPGHSGAQQSAPEQICSFCNSDLWTKVGFMFEHQPPLQKNQQIYVYKLKLTWKLLLKDMLETNLELWFFKWHNFTFLRTSLASSDF